MYNLTMLLSLALVMRFYRGIKRDFISAVQGQGTPHLLRKSGTPMLLRYYAPTDTKNFPSLPLSHLFIAWTYLRRPEG